MQLKATRRSAMGALLAASIGFGQSGKKTRILVLCTGNSARSQMSEGFLRHWDKSLEVFSAGTSPSPRVNPYAIRAMKELEIDIGGGTPKKVDQFVGQNFDFVVTVCDDADKNCPRFAGKVGKRLHIGFPDPAKAKGSDEQVMAVFREVRDDIQVRIREFYQKEVKGQL